MRTTMLSVVVGVGLLLGGVTLSAHHAFSSEFDANRPVKFKGTVSKMISVQDGDRTCVHDAGIFHRSAEPLQEILDAQVVDAKFVFGGVGIAIRC